MYTYTDKQIEILNKAIDLIPKRGLSSITFKKLAVELKVTEPAIFRHFKSKKEFVKQLYNYSKNLFHKKLQSIIYKNVTPDKKLLLLLKENLSFLENQKGANFYLLTYSIINNDAELMLKMENIITGYKEIIKCIIEEGIKSNIFKNVDTDIQADIFLGITQTLVIQYVLSNQKRKFKHKAESMYNVFLNGIKT